MTDGIAARLTPTTVIRNGKVRAAGRRVDQVTVDDLWIDVIVGPPDHPYRMLDLHEYAAAMASGALDLAEAADGLVRTQRFLDRRLNRRYDHAARTWLDFPPAEVEQLMDLRFPRRWSTIDD